MKPDRKQKILSAAVKLFAEKGAGFVRLAEVAKAAKVPPPLIHYYYDTVEDLHFDIIQAAVADLVDYSTRNHRPADQADKAFREYIRGPLQWIDEKPALASIMIYFYYMAAYLPRFEELSTMIRVRGRERISMLIYRGIEQKHFKLPDGYTVEQAAYDVQAVITGHSLLYATEKRRLKVGDQLELTYQNVMKLLGA